MLSTCDWMETSSARDRLVADDELGPQGQGAGDADALALAAGELVRVAAGVVVFQAHLLAGSRCTISTRSLRRADAVDLQALAMTDSPIGMRGSSEDTGPGR